LNGQAAEVTIERLDGATWNAVYKEATLIENLGKPSTKDSVEDVNFAKEFFPNVIGSYRATLSLNLYGTIVSKTFSFNIDGGLAGTYTIDANKVTAGTNFQSFEDAINALYAQGVEENVVFELQNSSYLFENNTVTGINNIPDFRSKIMGAGKDATITFKPAFELMTEQNPIELRISNPEGYGIRFGQAIVSNTETAAVNFVRDTINRKDLANSEGYIIFDGGAYKNILITMTGENTYNGKAFSSPIYFDAGTKNITIKNCRIIGETEEIRNSVDLPLMNYRAEIPEFAFQDNVFGSGDNILTYSAGIAMRNIPLKSVLIDNVNFTADATITENNIIEGNVISNFGYGIVSIGMGSRVKNIIEIEPMYNKNNKFINNYIESVAKAGIFLGFEENATISGNRITNILGTSGTPLISAGIQAGYISENAAYFGYNNIGLNFEKNEIDNVKSNVSSYGILINQPSFEVEAPNRAKYYFPSDKSEFSITNNIIYNLNHFSDQQRAGRFGIAISPDNNNLNSSRFLDINRAFVANNTILIEDLISAEENRTLDNSVAGILAFEVDKFDIYNNAIYVKIDTLTKYDYVAALALRGINPKRVENQIINNNAYFIDSMTYLRKENHPNSAVVRFIELDKFGRALDSGGFDSEYKTLEQWINWTEMDKNSVYVNFAKDMEMARISITPDIISSKLRMKAANNLAKDLALNNRGIMLSKVATDIDNVKRNTSGRNYDIGAIEFEAELLLSDLEIRYISAPAAYRNNISKFNDAEYIMIKNNQPVEIKAIIRNNGKTFLANVPIICSIIPNVTPAGATIRDEKVISISPGEEMEVTFFQENTNKFEPTPFAQWTGAASTPDKPEFNTMRTTVTPIYTIRVATNKADEKIANDTAAKKVRFYVPQAQLRTLISAENSFAELYDINRVAVEDDAEIVAGRLNYDTVTTAFGNMQYSQNTAENKSHYDVFDRKGWEPRSVDYTIYNCVIWSDGDDKSLSYWEKQNLIDFVNSGSADKKTTLIVASQEMLRENNDKIADEFNSELQANVIRAIAKGEGIYEKTEDIKIRGFYENYNLIMGVDNTDYEVEAESFVDKGPKPGIFTMVDTAYGNNHVAYYYYPIEENNQSAREENISVISAKMLTRNVIFAAIDWRHLGNATAFLGGILSDIGNDLIHSDDPNPFLSIELADFNAKALGKKVLLDWTTNSEFNISDFEIERANIFSSNVGIFSTIASEKAAGFTNSEKTYNIVDNGVAYNNQYVYRLKMNDFDGNYTYSDEKIVNIEYAKGVSIGDVTPNPVKELAKVEYSLGNESNVKISLNDLSGGEVATLFDGIKNTGMHEVEIDSKNLASGTYHLIFVIDGQVIEKTTIVNIVK
jgi:hypothetical protein